MVADKWVTLSVALPVIASFLVTVIAVKVVAPFVHDDPIRLVAPALITFLPGATLTIATIELASDQIVSGASRLVWGVSQLLLLAFGVFVGLSLVGTVDADRRAPGRGLGAVGRRRPGRHRLPAVRQRAAGFVALPVDRAVRVLRGADARVRRCSTRRCPASSAAC